MASDSISTVITVHAEADGAPPVVPIHGVAAIASPVAPSPQGKPWTLPPSGLAVFYGRPETPRLFHYFLPRLLAAGKQVLCLDGANRFDPLLIARLARQRGIETAEFNRRIRVARAFTCFQLTELLVRVPRLLEKFPADALIVTALPDLYFDEDVRERDACVAFRHALDALCALRPLPLGVAVFSDATSFETQRSAGRGLHLEPARNGRGLHLEPARNGRGLHLEPARNGRGLYLEPARNGRGLYLEPARKKMFGQLTAQATELWRFELDKEGGKLRLIGEKNMPSIT